jgi:hypothetical protein
MRDAHPAYAGLPEPGQQRQQLIATHWSRLSRAGRSAQEDEKLGTELAPWFVRYKFK